MSDVEWQLLQADTTLLVALTGALGCVVGSFLNVLCLRLPLMLERQWQAQSREMLGLPEQATEVFNLAFPPSRCPVCAHQIRAWENIPVFSYLLLRGRCAGCNTRISLRYPIVEAACGFLSAVVAWRFGVSWECLAALLFSWALLALAVIDFDTQLLPDDMTLPLLWGGLALALFAVFVPLRNAVIGAMAGYLLLWSVYWVFKLLTGKEGMGYGDFKLLAALGAWLGWQMLPVVVLLSSMVGAVVGLLLILLRGRDRQIPMPFGPYLAAAGWIALLWGQDILRWYIASSPAQL